MTRRRPALVLAVVTAAAVALGACATGERPELAEPAEGSETATADPAGSADTSADADPATGSTPTTGVAPDPTDPAAPNGPVAPNGIATPVAATDPAGLAADITRAEQALRDPATPPEQVPELARLQQVSYRVLARVPEWDAEVLAAVPDDLDAVVSTHLDARRAFARLRTTVAETVPAWQIVAPEPAEALLSHYLEAEELTGIEWEYLAAINLVETGMGRIDGLSTAGAQGPMQFLPTTWEEVGEGDIDDPHDAIIGAARYLVRRGGPADMDGALFGYNNHEGYVDGVSAYASLMRDDPSVFTALYHWEIWYVSSAGDLWLPVGTLIPESMPAVDFVAANPWVAPPVG